MQKFLWELVIKTGSVIGILLVLIFVQALLNAIVYPELNNEPHRPSVNLFQHLFTFGLYWKIIGFKFAIEEKEEIK